MSTTNEDGSRASAQKLCIAFKIAKVQTDKIFVFYLLHKGPNS